MQHQTDGHPEFPSIHGNDHHSPPISRTDTISQLHKDKVSTPVTFPSALPGSRSTTVHHDGEQQFTSHSPDYELSPATKTSPQQCSFGAGISKIKSKRPQITLNLQGSDSSFTSRIPTDSKLRFDTSEYPYAHVLSPNERYPYGCTPLPGWESPGSCFNSNEFLLQSQIRVCSPKVKFPQMKKPSIWKPAEVRAAAIPAPCDYVPPVAPPKAKRPIVLSYEQILQFPMTTTPGPGAYHSDILSHSPHKDSASMGPSNRFDAHRLRTEWLEELMRGRIIEDAPPLEKKYFDTSRGGSPSQRSQRSGRSRKSIRSEIREQSTDLFDVSRPKVKGPTIPKARSRTVDHINTLHVMPGVGVYTPLFSSSSRNAGVWERSHLRRSPKTKSFPSPSFFDIPRLSFPIHT